MLSLLVGLVGKSEVVLGLSQFILSLPLGLFSLVDFDLGVVEILVGAVEVLLSILKSSVSLGLSEFLSIELGLGSLEGLLGSCESLLSLVELALRVSQILLGLPDVRLGTSLVEKSEVELVLGLVEGFVSLAETSSGVLPFGVGLSGSGSSLVSRSLSSGQLDVNVVEHTLPGGQFRLGLIDNSEGSEELFISRNLLGLDGADIEHEGHGVADGDLVEAGSTTSGNSVAVSDSDGHEAFSSVSTLIGSLHTEGVNASDTEGTADASSSDVAVEAIGEVEEGVHGGANSVGHSELVVEGLTNTDNGGV